MEDNLNFYFEKLEWRPQKNWRRLGKNGRRPQKIKWKTNQSTKVNLIGCDTIVNSPSLFLLLVVVLFWSSTVRSSLRLSGGDTLVAGLGGTIGASLATATTIGSWHHHCLLCKTFWRHVKSMLLHTIWSFQLILTLSNARLNVWPSCPNQEHFQICICVEILFLGWIAWSIWVPGSQTVSMVVSLIWSRKMPSTLTRTVHWTSNFTLHTPQ